MASCAPSIAAACDGVLRALEPQVPLRALSAATCRFNAAKRMCSETVQLASAALAFVSVA